MATHPSAGVGVHDGDARGELVGARATAWGGCLPVGRSAAVAAPLLLLTLRRRLWWRRTSAPSRRRAVAALKHEDRFPFDRRKADSRFPRKEGIPLSLYTPFPDLPPNGKALTEREETCDPEMKFCQTPTYVYEAECALCKGTGQVESKWKGRHRVYTCTLCQGLGYVRRTTTRFIPDLNGTGPNMTINRPLEKADLPPHLRNGHNLRNGHTKDS